MDKILGCCLLPYPGGKITINNDNVMTEFHQKNFIFHITQDFPLEYSKVMKIAKYDFESCHNSYLNAECLLEF